MALADGGFSLTDHPSNYCCVNPYCGLNLAFKFNSGICLDLAGFA